MLGEPSKQHLWKLANAAQKSFAECALLLDENQLLFKQNNESKSRKSVRPFPSPPRCVEDFATD
jgi:hypothetical protein